MFNQQLKPRNYHETYSTTISLSQKTLVYNAKVPVIPLRNLVTLSLDNFASKSAQTRHYFNQCLSFKITLSALNPSMTI
jgi:hypothetical protein